MILIDFIVGMSISFLINIFTDYSITDYQWWCIIIPSGILYGIISYIWEETK